MSTPDRIKSDERRIAARVALDVEVGLESESNFYTGLTQDISTGGLFVATHDLRPVGERLHVRFTLPDDPTPISVAAEVRWLRPPPSPDPDMPSGMGLRFLDIGPAEARAVARFIEQRESLFYDDD